jgi:hypothetical protein
MGPRYDPTPDRAGSFAAVVHNWGHPACVVAYVEGEGRLVIESPEAIQRALLQEWAEAAGGKRLVDELRAERRAATAGDPPADGARARAARPAARSDDGGPRAGAARTLRRGSCGGAGRVGGARLAGAGARRRPGRRVPATGGDLGREPVRGALSGTEPGAERGGPAGEAGAARAGGGAVHAEDARAATEIDARDPRHLLSLADRCCLATAAPDAPGGHGRPGMGTLDLGVDVVAFR